MIEDAFKRAGGGVNVKKSKLFVWKQARISYQDASSLGLFSFSVSLTGHDQKKKKKKSWASIYHSYELHSSKELELAEFRFAEEGDIFSD